MVHANYTIRAINIHGQKKKKIPTITKKISVKFRKEIRWTRVRLLHDICVYE